MITDQKISRIPFNYKDPQTVYICNLDIEFDGLGSDYLERYQCVIYFKTHPTNNLLQNGYSIQSIRRFPNR